MDKIGRAKHYHDGSSESYLAPVSVTVLSTVSTMALFYWLSLSPTDKKRTGDRSTTLPGYGILGDKVNEMLEIFLDALAIYVNNDKNVDCSRRMLCEANQRAGDFGTVQGIIMYVLSLTVSFVLRNQRVSESMEAMRKGRHGLDCISSYPKCPFSL